MRIRLFLTVGAAIALVALSAPPAEAGKPSYPDEPVVNTFDAWNPCMGTVEEHTIVFTPFDHFHNNNVVFQDKNRHGWTASGYVMEHGQFHVIGVDGGPFVRQFIDIFRHPNGSAYRTMGTLRFTGNSPAVDVLKLTCLTGPTLPQP